MLNTEIDPSAAAPAQLSGEVDGTGPAKAAPVIKKPAAKKAGADEGYPQFMQSVTNNPYVDPQTGIRYSPGFPIKVEVAPKAGSWLDCQIKAGYIGKA